MKVRINEAEEILKGAEKLSAQLNKSEWAKMPKVKEDKVKEKEYACIKDILNVKAEEIKVTIDNEIVSAYFTWADKRFYINSKFIPKFISEGIIAEKKSKADELADEISERIYWELKYLSRPAIRQIILEELENAGIN